MEENLYNLANINLPKPSIQIENNVSRIFQKIHNGDKVNLICLTSMTFDSVLTEGIIGVEHYEMRCLWEISRVKKPNISVHFFSKRKVHPEAINHYFDVFNFSEAERSRVFFYSVEEILGTNNLSDDLSDYVLKNSLVSAQFKKLGELKNAFMELFVLSKKEVEICHHFGIDSWWNHQDIEYFKTKSGNRRILSGVTKIPRGFGDLHSVEDVANHLLKLAKLTNGKKFVVKLNDGVSGDGNGVVRLPESSNLTIHKIRQALIETNFVSSKMSYTKFFREMAKLGGVVEEYIEGEDKCSPSVQIFLQPNGSFEILSTHEQILDGSGARFLGARFPALNRHRQLIINEAKKVAQKLIDMKIYGIVGLDFLTTEDLNGKIETYLIEINMRKGGTTHPFWSTKFAIDGTVSDKTGKLVCDLGERIYRSNDNIITQNPNRSLKDLIQLVRSNKILFNPDTKKGIIFHMLNSYPSLGKLGAVFIGEKDAELVTMEKKLLNLIA